LGRDSALIESLGDADYVYCFVMRIRARQDREVMLDRPSESLGTVLHLPYLTGPLPPAAFGDRYGMLPLRNIESHKGFVILSHGPFPCVRLGSVRPSNPRPYRTKARPLASHQEHYA
jgi:hypothetical protein